jgi:hypothetical protein
MSKSQQAPLFFPKPSKMEATPTKATNTSVKQSKGGDLEVGLE